MRPRTLIIGGLSVVALLLLGTSGGQVAQQIEAAIDQAFDWMGRVVGRVSRHEGGYASLNLNKDGAGLSFGILQWVQAKKTLGGLLREMYAADPERFAHYFGGPQAAQELLKATAAGSLAPVGGAVLWQEPWIGRFRAAGEDPVFQAVQDRVAVEGEHFQGALAAARELGLMTERSIALMYDTAVQEGPGRAKSLARKVRQTFTGQTVEASHVLKTFATLDAARYRRTTPPTEEPSSAHLEWREVDGEWHLFAGSFDLYRDITRRRTAIVNDPDLSDSPVTMPAGLA